MLPLPVARPFHKDAKLFAEIAKRARRRYREDGDFDPSLYGEKVRELIDEHMTSLGVDQILPSISITDPEYAKRAARLSPRARASEMEHAIRHHINLHMDEDPVRYRRLSERLEQILAEHRDNWEQQAFALSEFMDTIDTDDIRTPGDDSPSTNPLESALYGLLAEETATGTPRPPREFVSGEGFLYLGRSYRLLLVDEPARPVRLHRGRLEMRRDYAEGNSEDATRHLVRWYRQVGEPWLRKRVIPWAQRMEVDITGLRILPLGYRWGSCSADGRLNIHWATMQLSPDLVDYVLVHELAHVRNPRHDAAFWHAVELPLPDFHSRRIRLREAGPALWLPLSRPSPELTLAFVHSRPCRLYSSIETRSPAVECHTPSVSSLVLSVTPGILARGDPERW